MDFNLLLDTPVEHNCEKHGSYTQVFKMLSKCSACVSEKLAREAEIESLKSKYSTDIKNVTSLYDALEYANLPKRHSGCTFENYVVNEKNNLAYETMLKFAKNTDNLTKKGIGVLFLGTSGIGKTHLCAATINYIIRTHRRFAIYCKQYEIVEMYLREREKFTEILDVALLVIDEIGVTENSLTKEVMYQIIDKRYDAMQPTILISNKLPDEFYSSNTPAFNSRLAESMFELTASGEDYRLTKNIKISPLDLVEEKQLVVNKLHDEFKQNLAKF